MLSCYPWQWLFATVLVACCSVYEQGHYLSIFLFLELQGIIRFKKVESTLEGIPFRNYRTGGFIALIQTMLARKYGLVIPVFSSQCVGTSKIWKIQRDLTWQTKKMGFWLCWRSVKLQLLRCEAVNQAMNSERWQFATNLTLQRCLKKITVTCFLVLRMAFQKSTKHSWRCWGMGNTVELWIQRFLQVMISMRDSSPQSPSAEGFEPFERLKKPTRG